jgi:hypothetical protein
MVTLIGECSAYPVIREVMILRDSERPLSRKSTGSTRSSKVFHAVVSGGELGELAAL